MTSVAEESTTFLIKTKHSTLKPIEFQCQAVAHSKFFRGPQVEKPWPNIT